MALTKTNFMRGMQCPKMLWLDRHKPSLMIMIIPPEIQARLDAGNEFGDRAMGMFGPYEEMTGEIGTVLLFLSPCTHHAIWSKNRYE